MERIATMTMTRAGRSTTVASAAAVMSGIMIAMAGGQLLQKCPPVRLKWNCVSVAIISTRLETIQNITAMQKAVASTAAVRIPTTYHPPGATKALMMKVVEIPAARVAQILTGRIVRKHSEMGIISIKSSFGGKTMNQRVSAILQEIEKVIVGKNEVVEKIMMAVLAGGHVLMEDVPGVGKTTTAMTFAKVLGLETRRVQFTSDTVPSDIIGYSVYDKECNGFVYKPGAVMTNLLLADEINRTSSKTQSALLEAMEEMHVTVDGSTYPLPTPFIVLATQNPIGSAGTQMLPNSQLDRFMIKISMGYPDFASQVNILRDRHKKNPLDEIHPVLNIDQLQLLIRETGAVDIHDRIYEYITALCQATREHPMVQLGVSPRGALAVCRMAKAYAYLQGRDYVIPEDVTAVFPDVCTHRLILNAKARMMEEKPESVIQTVLRSVNMPVIKQ